MMSDWLRARTQEWNNLAEAQERVARRPRIEIVLTTVGSSDRDRAEELKRNLTPEYLAALRQKLGV